jgi:MerC mercury resistance protein
MNADTETVFVPHTERTPSALRPLGCAEEQPHAHAKLDRLGMWLSAACAVHCAVVPVVQIFFPVLLMMKWIRWSRTMDIVTIGVAAIFGLGGCLLGLRHHRNLTPLFLVIAGLLLNITSRLGSVYLGPYITPSLLVAGAMVMAYGLWRDRQLCKCTDPAHSH